MVPASLTAIIIGASPLFSAILAHMMLNDDRLTFRKLGSIFLGIAGVDGNGQLELGRSITGLILPSSGTVEIGDTDTTGYTPDKLLKLGLSHIPADRHRTGLILDYSVEDNLVTKEETSPKERQEAFTSMMKIALELAD